MSSTGRPLSGPLSSYAISSVLVRTRFGVGLVESAIAPPGAVCWACATSGQAPARPRLTTNSLRRMGNLPRAGGVFAAPPALQFRLRWIERGEGTTRAPRLQGHELCFCDGAHVAGALRSTKPQREP